MPFLRACSTVGLASTSNAVHRWSTSCCTAAVFHTSSIQFAESRKQQKSRIMRKVNVERKEERARKEKENAPHVILGTRPGQESKWEKCDLAKTIITAEQLESMPPLPSTDYATPPQYMNFGLDGLDGKQPKDELKEFLFTDLPEASLVASIDQHLADKLRIWRDIGEEPKIPDDRRKLGLAEVREQEKAKQLARLVDLRNANARGIAFENRRRIIAAFSPTGKAVDSGYPEVQVALLTMKIRNVWNHLMQRKKDIAGRRSLRQLVHQRAKMLKYIKRIDPRRYERVLERVALEPKSVEGELVV